MLLIALAPTPDEARALDDRLARDYGPKGPWAAIQRERLAWDNEPDEVERRLAALQQPRPRPVAPPPTNPAEREAELRERAARVLEACRATLGSEHAAIDVRVDTTGKAPAAMVRGGARQARACLRREAEGRFRSVGPARVVFRIDAGRAESRP